jgi:diguanylate cyclase (GGDEF)-like protein
LLGQNKEMSQRAHKDSPLLSSAELGFDLKLFDSLVDGVLIVDENKKLLYANPSVQQLCGLHSTRVGKKDLSSFLVFKPDIFEQSLKEIVDVSPYREVMLIPATGSPARVQVTIQPFPGHLLNGHIQSAATPQFEQWLIYIHDVTLEERLQQKYFGQIREKEEFIKKLDRKLYETSLMFELAQGMNFFRELPDVLNLILLKLEDAFVFSHSVVGTVDRENFFAQTKLVRHGGSPMPKLPRSQQQKWVTDYFPTALAQGEPRFLKKGENLDLELFIRDCFDVDFSNYLFVPLLHKEEAGFLVMLDCKQAWRGDDDDLSLLFGIASQLLLAVDNNRLYEESMVDPLTGLYNLRYFQERLVQEFRKAKNANLKLAVLMIDVDFFKNFNDTYGHAVGDSVLKQVAQCIAKSCREKDTAARYGGEEFVVILPDADSQTALIAAERIRKKIESSVLKVGDEEVHITASIGASCYPDVCSAMTELVPFADHAMYVAKKSGRNNSKTYIPE